VHRRLVAHWSSIAPFVATYGITANSDFYPLVDQRTSKTRFTQARVDELTQLQASPIPLLEIFDPGVRAELTAGVVYPVTLVDFATSDAVLIRESTLG